MIYIGQYSHGTTSRMRGEILKNLLCPESFRVIDTHVPFNKSNRFWRSIAFRFKFGIAVKKINDHVVKELSSEFVDLIWVDKATFLTENVIRLLRNHTKKLIHFTPDMMFYANKSQSFIRSLNYYDVLVTTKKKEVEMYHTYVDPKKVYLVTQGYDPSIHRSQQSFNEKSDSVVFIGLAEPSRAEIIQYLIGHRIDVQLAGFGWNSFLKRNKNSPYLAFHGTVVSGENYSKLISSAKFGLGLLSKRFPELHTTRTFEIPACGTALLTEQNEEIRGLFEENEVIYFNSKEDLVKRIQYFLKESNELENLTTNGMSRVKSSGYDYKSIISSILQYSGI
ncbi:CgeB family protein [Mongoliitalea lutea]|uniref:CgeB family protein n=1 Tax=Mongoliitalea lutea TaxID=849756 RepID=UPI001E2CC176|nr:glycosyltransferase [Mongoliitalea lutea]